MNRKYTRLPKLRIFRLSSIVAGQWVLLAGLVLIISGIALDRNALDVGTILATIGTTALTASIVGIIYEAFQKEAFAGDLQGMFNISASLQESGIVNVAEPSNVMMSRLLTQRELTLIPINPVDWYSQYKSMLYRAVCQRGTKIVIWVPEYDNASIADILSQRGEHTANEFVRELQSFLGRIEQDWNSASVHRDSHLEVRSYKDIPRIGVYFGEVESILEYQSVSPEFPTVHSHMWVEVKAEGTFHKWSSSEVSRVGANTGAVVRLIRPAQTAIGNS